jgi:hypothetical protein
MQNGGFKARGKPFGKSGFTGGAAAVYGYYKRLLPMPARGRFNRCQRAFVEGGFHLMATSS